jgi:hypothetical protein
LRAIAAIGLLAGALPAAAVDTFTVDHESGPCSANRFITLHTPWGARQRIPMASGERIHVTLYSHGADLAQDATGSNIYEWIAGRGTTTNYPGAPIVAGSRVAKGYVTIAIRADAEHGTGNRTVTVKWLTGNETIPIRIVANCDALAGLPYRSAAPSGSGGSSVPVVGAIGGGVIGGGVSAPATFVDVAPRANMVNLFRRQSQSPAFTQNGAQFFAIDSQRYCNDMSGNQSRIITIPNPVWGVTNVGTASVGTAFASQLRSGAQLLATGNVTALNPGQTVDFTFARANGSRVRVSTFLDRVGCFVSPTADAFFEDPPFTVVVNTNGAITENAANQANNSRTY